MKVLMICVGSRGDAEPFCALADKLLQDGHQVDMFLQPELQGLAPTNVTTLHSFPFTQFDFYKYVSNPSHGGDHENPRVRFVGVVADVIGELVLPCAPQILQAASNVDVVITSNLARSVGFLISEKYKIPTCLVQLQPLVPTHEFPHYSQQDDFLKAVLQESNTETTSTPEANLETHVELERYQHEFLQERLDQVYKDNNLAVITLEQVLERITGRHPLTTVCNAYSPQLLPTPKDVGSNVETVGPLADAYIPQDFVPPPSDLVEFLKNKPVCIGFGSMPYDQVTMILQGLESIDQKAILVGDALKLPEQPSEWVQANIRHVSGLPYAWLLPQCQMMMSHGGAGVVHATLRAGIPALIAPLMGDQFVFAELLQAKGLGVRVASLLSKATQDDFVNAIQQGKKCLETSRAFGEEARNQSLGVDAPSTPFH